MSSVTPKGCQKTKQLIRASLTRSQRATDPTALCGFALDVKIPSPSSPVSTAFLFSLPPPISLAFGFWTLFRSRWRRARRWFGCSLQWRRTRGGGPAEAKRRRRGRSRSSSRSRRSTLRTPLPSAMAASEPWCGAVSPPRRSNLTVNNHHPPLPFSS